MTYRPKVKKLHWLSTFGEIEIIEKQFRKENRVIRPFSKTAQIVCRDYSTPLQRALIDFGCEESFKQAAKRVKTHYGIDVPIGGIRNATLNCGKEIQQKKKRELDLNYQEEKALNRPGNKMILTQVDGTMIPIVKIDEEKMQQKENNEKKIDRRKFRKTCWKEVRLSVAKEINHQDSSKNTEKKYGAGFSNVDETGINWLRCSIKAGLGKNTKIHSINDGALWIKDQFDKKFKTIDDKSFLIDFHHISDYIALVTNHHMPKNKRKPWLKEQQELLKENNIEKVLRNLSPYIKKENKAKDQFPANDCHRYLTNRLDQLDYKSAINDNLPIGSGEVESSHRYVIQKRMKIAGAWWKKDNASYMLDLREQRANDEWDEYWREKLSGGRRCEMSHF